MKGIGTYGNDFAVIRKDDNLIKEGIFRLLFTSSNERPMSNFGIGLQDLLFEMNSLLEEDLYNLILSSIEKYEPRVQVIKVSLTPVDVNKINLELKFRVKSTGEVDEINTNIIP